MKVISFSLWGDDKLYCQGAIDNVACAKEHYPDWTCRFYVDVFCPALPVLKNMDCEVHEVESIYLHDDPRCVQHNAIDRTQKDWHMNEANKGMLWRFLAIDDPNVETVIFRDCDSRIGAREAQAVKEWMRSGFPMHRMHECKEHWNAQVMGGMWGIYPNAISGSIANSISDYITKYRQIRNEPWIFVDLWWIMDCLWPYMHDRCMGHGFGHPNPFVIDGPMVGGVVNEEWRGIKYEPN